MTIRVSFTYEPDDPDDDHEMGVTEAEHQAVSDKLMFEFGAEDVNFERLASEPPVERQPKS